MRLILTISMMLALFLVRAQDIHYTQWYDQALQLNPSLTGRFDGAYRFTGNFRQQWRAISTPFQTISVSADARDFLRIRNFGLGIAFFNDVAGDGRYTTNDIKLSGSHNFRLTSDTVHSLQLGWQLAYQARRMHWEKFEFGEQWNGMQFDPLRPTGEIGQLRDAVRLANFGFGLGYTWQKEERKNFQVGITINNTTEPAIGWLASQPSILFRRWNGYFISRFWLNYDLDLEPYALYQRQGRFQELVVGTSLRYILDPRFFHYRAVFIGVSSRIGDAANGIAGIYYGPWKFGISYDVNYSPLIAASNYRGGVEVNAIYILRNVLPKRLRYRSCPNYL